MRQMPGLKINFHKNEIFVMTVYQMLNMTKLVNYSAGSFPLPYLCFY
jgi:hypothetical protein